MVSPRPQTDPNMRKQSHNCQPIPEHIRQFSEHLGPDIFRKLDLVGEVDFRYGWISKAQIVRASGVPHKQ